VGVAPQRLCFPKTKERKCSERDVISQYQKEAPGKGLVLRRGRRFGSKKKILRGGEGLWKAT